MGGCVEEGDIPGTPNTLPHNILSELYHQLGLLALFLKICMVLDMF